MAPALSPVTERRVAALFGEKIKAEACALLIDECGNNLPFCQDLDEFKLERIRFAALKLSGGDIDRLKRAIHVAKHDWRDLLMAAGFAHEVTAHERWFPDKSSE
jgi:hypothetical protein